MFKPSARKDVNLNARGGSLNRNLPQTSTQQQQQQQLGFGMSANVGGSGYERSLRQGTPVPPGERGSSQGPDQRSMSQMQDPYARPQQQQLQQQAMLSPY